MLSQNTNSTCLEISKDVSSNHMVLFGFDHDQCSDLISFIPVRNFKFVGISYICFFLKNRYVNKAHVMSFLHYQEAAVRRFSKI